MKIEWKMIFKPSRFSNCKGSEGHFDHSKKHSFSGGSKGTSQLLGFSSALANQPCVNFSHLHLWNFWIKQIIQTVRLLHVVNLLFLDFTMWDASKSDILKHPFPQPNWSQNQLFSFLRSTTSPIQEPTLSCPNVRHAHTKDLQRRSVTLDLGLDQQKPCPTVGGR